MKSNYKSHAYILGDLSLPNTVTTRNGVVFDSSKSRWAYRDGHKNISLNFKNIKCVSDNFMLCMKLTLIWYIENKSADHVSNLFSRMKHFLETIFDGEVISIITDADVLNYRAQLDMSTQWYVASLSGFIKKWYALGFPGITKEAVDLLNDIRLKGNLKGEAVLTMDPIMGPFTDVERAALHSALDSAYAKTDISTEDYLLGLLVALLGQRPVQYSYLKVCDVLAEQRSDDSYTYILRVPRAKQRGQLPRSTFKEKVIIPQVGKLLFEYTKAVETLFAERLQDPRQAPLFPDVRGTANYSEGFQFHRTAELLKQRITIIFSNLNVQSERTGGPIPIAPVRFRRTLGTQAAAEGHGPLVIAELLDHSDLQNVGVYVAASPEFMERIDRAVAARLAPLAQAFAGVLVDGKTEQDVPYGRRVVASKYSQNFKPVGSCGQHGFCSFAAPIACYTCLNFRAWLDGPHGEILDYLLAERDRQMQVDKRIAAVNDRTILAVAQVVEMCNEAQTRRDSDV